MGLALDTNAYTSTSTGAGNFIAAAPFAGDVAAVRNFGAADVANLVSFGRKGATVGTARIRSALFHDDVQGLRFRALAADPTDHLGHYDFNTLYAQDAPLVDGDGTNLEVEAYVTTTWYRNLPGAAARLYMPADVLPNIDVYVAQQVTITAVVPPNWASIGLVSLYNTLKPNRDYAVLGFQSDVPLAGVAILGSDTGNLKAGGPCPADIFKTRDYFVKLASDSQLPMIPVINAASAPATNAMVANDIAAVGANVTFILGLLRQNLA